MKYRIVQKSKNWYVPQYKGWAFWNSWRKEPWREYSRPIGFDNIKEAQSFLTDAHEYNHVEKKEYPKTVYETEM